MVKETLSTLIQNCSSVADLRGILEKKGTKFTPEHVSDWVATMKRLVQESKKTIVLKEKSKKCYLKKKQECAQFPEDCEWTVGKGCRKRSTGAKKVPVLKKTLAKPVVADTKITIPKPIVKKTRIPKKQGKVVESDSDSEKESEKRSDSDSEKELENGSDGESDTSKSKSSEVSDSGTSGSDDGSDNGSDNGSDDGSDDNGSEKGSDNGSDNGSDDKSDNGSDDGSDNGSEKGSDNGSDDESIYSVPPSETEAKSPIDKKPIIIDSLTHLQNNNKGDKFRYISYKRVIDQLKRIQTPIYTKQDVLNLGMKGVGKSIIEKIEAILNGDMSQFQADPTINIISNLSNIYGVGLAKAKTLVEQGIKSIADLREKTKANPKLLNKNQTLGLKYYDDLLKRIPRAEMDKHNALLKGTAFKGINPDSWAIAGSYRRGLADSGDIDVLFTESGRGKVTSITNIVNALKTKGYIIETLAQGTKKFMGICAIEKDGPPRRLDIMFTPINEWPLALLYFTGSKEFNTKMRTVALKKGYTMNEHKLTKKDVEIPEPPEFKTEKDVFEFLEMPFVEPKNRV